MRATSYSGRPPAPGEMAAVIAAVQAYLDHEARGSHARGHRRRTAWKTAAWLPLRGGTPGRDLSWKDALRA